MSSSKFNNFNKECIIVCNTIKELIAEIQEYIFNKGVDEQDDMATVKLFFDRIHHESAYQHVRNHILPHKKQINKRDLLFFLENKGLFSGLPEDKIRYYSREITNPKRISSEDMDSIWDYFTVLIEHTELAQKYE